MRSHVNNRSFSASFPAERGLSAKQLVNRLAAHSDRKIEIRGRFDGGWSLWLSSPDDSKSFILTSIKSARHDFESAYDDICHQVVDLGIFDKINYETSFDNSVSDLNKQSGAKSLTN